MKAPQGVLVLGWIILCSTVVFLFNEQITYQFPTKPMNAPKIVNKYAIKGHRGVKPEIVNKYPIKGHRGVKNSRSIIQMHI